MNVKKEYYEFGPWLTQIEEGEDLTHQFVHLKDVILASDIAFKIPVDKEWREVREGELLYDTVITLDEKAVTCHRIIDDVAYSKSIKFSNFEYVRMVENMLSCDIEIGTTEERLNFMYVPIPHELSEKLIELVLTGLEANNKEVHLNKMAYGKVTLKYKDSFEFTDEVMDELLVLAK